MSCKSLFISVALLLLRPIILCTLLLPHIYPNQKNIVTTNIKKSYFIKNKVIIIYPLQDFSGTFTKGLPSSLIYASTELIKNKIEVELLDNRLYPEFWGLKLRNLLTANVIAVGVSVVPGKSIVNAIEVGRIVKSIDQKFAVRWGGVHAAFSPKLFY
jgi:hypothetical protein